jgi:hypothetical protein
MFGTSSAGEPIVTAGASTWHALGRAFKRMGRDWAIIFRCPQDLPCIVCHRPTHLMVRSSTRRAALLQDVPGVLNRRT